MSAAPSRFVGGETLDAMLAPAGLSLADWKALAAHGAVPPATYAWARAARWRRTDVAAFVTQHAAQAQPATYKSETN